ncbi:hypothetical protein [Thiothrix lacustris]|uniref:hypothetical protein n=1 Tax=Thiothrix lacustris TaxID=525917 RepID=UPI0027E51DB2|nr:hypothetical protein [Thiothrix lacustris]WMP15899.1 hypothetical protein RCS87_10880 [Thiothrix lacustris]
MSVAIPEEDTLTGVLNIPGVNGFTLTDELGEVLHSNIDEQEVNEFIAFLAGMLPAIGESAQLGIIQSAICKSPQMGNILMISKDNLSLGITTESRSRMHEINQQVDALLHWN